jgi:cobalamin biosynthesis Mg chelatase CobN
MAVLYPPDPVVIDDAPLLKWDIGGAEANCAIALARLGVTSRFHTRIGNDPFGRRMVDILSGEGVDTSAMQVDATRPTGVFFREWLADGARRVLRGSVKVPPPVDYPEVGVYHPRMAGRLSEDAATLPGPAAASDPAAPAHSRAVAPAPRGTVGLLLLRSYLLGGNARHYDGVITALEARGLKVVPAFAAGLDSRPAIERFFM